MFSNNLNLIGPSVYWAYLTTYLFHNELSLNKILPSPIKSLRKSGSAIISSKECTSACCFGFIFFPLTFWKLRVFGHRPFLIGFVEWMLFGHMQSKFQQRREQQKDKCYLPNIFYICYKYKILYDYLRREVSFSLSSTFESLSSMEGFCF